MTRLILSIISLCGPFLFARAAEERQVISLDGTWQIAEGTLSAVPAKFEREVVVPGLVDMARPSFVDPGPKTENTPAQKDSRRDAFWYRRTFTLAGPLPAVATLKVGKAMFGTRVILNGSLLGDHLPCFTAGFFNAREALKPGENEVIIRVGADRDAVRAGVPTGFDYEKERYIPGIFDSVELILSGTPNITNLQVVPDLTNQLAKVRLWLKNATAGEMNIEVCEAKSGRVVGTISARIGAEPEQVLDLAVPIADCRLWTPETPFLYELTARTSGDKFTTRFGMREFKFDPATGLAVLNGKPYFMRGSNITLYRFFEDPDRGGLPWNQDWVRQLHRRVKDMNWNTLRYCIGFPPEFWYRIADEEGILIQDEFPIWSGKFDADELTGEFRQWMEERWNHPCVVIWDACNETSVPETGEAIQRVRGLDLSRRPWDNGWGKPGDPGDSHESHPYHFYNAKARLADLAAADPSGDTVYNSNGHRNNGTHAVIINEYGWLWLNRDGTPTVLTKKLYQNMLGMDSTTGERRHRYARYLAADTEFWRSHRKVAGVLHFTALGYSRPGGSTSDHWLDIAKLEWEPEFYTYVRDAFAPVGLMIDAWAELYPAGKKQKFPVVVINDLDISWKGTVRVCLLSGGATVQKKVQPCEVPALGRTNLVYEIDLPVQPGNYQLEAALIQSGADPVRSLRDFQTEDDPNGILLKPIPEKVVVLTFDDSCVSHATFVGPLLKKLGFGGTFYVTEAFKDKTKYMSWAQVKSLQDTGFEIGNHSMSHGMFSKQSVEKCIGELMGIESLCLSNQVTRPTTFCWPMYRVNKGFLPVMLEKGYVFGRGGNPRFAGERAYVPTTDNPLNTPSFTFHDTALKDKDSFANAAKQATPGKIVIFTFHGVPDLQHPGVGTEPARFEECMQYLKNNNYIVIAMRDMTNYVDEAKAAKHLVK